MVDNGIVPGLGTAAMAGSAINGIPGQLVVGIPGVIVVLQMTADTLPRRTDVDIVFMTVGTSRCLMKAQQGEGQMARMRPAPRRHAVMALPAIGGIIGLDMIGGALVLLAVAGIAVGRLTVKHIFLVTIAAIHGLVNPGQWKTGCLTMIPGIGLQFFPGKRRMTVGAMKAKIQLVRIVLPATPMTRFTIAGSTFQNTFQMTFSAGNAAMPALQGKIRLIVADRSPLLILRF